MKLGKRKMVTIFAQETGLPKEHIRIYGKYECFGNKERLHLGAHTLVAYEGTVEILEPIYGSFVDDKEITYRSRIIRGGEEDVR
jgi:hypothetical protein